MRRVYIGAAASVMVLAVGLAASAPAAPAARAHVIVLSNSAPHVSVVDAETRRVVRTVDIPNMTSWGWNDADNFFDGKHLWLGLRSPDTDDVSVMLLDLDTLKVSRRIPLGKDTITLYIGKPSRRNTVFVSKHASGEMAVISRGTFAVEVIKLPVGDGVACDMDVAVAPDGIERAYVPTDNANTVLAVDTGTRRVVKTATFQGSRPFMLTASPDGKQVWVQERTGDSITILNATDLSVIKRVPLGKTPIIGTFSPDGKRHYTGHVADTVVVAHEVATQRELWRARVGTSPDKVGVHPSGAFVYATLSREGALAILDAQTGNVLGRVSLGTNPTGIFVRRM